MQRVTLIAILAIAAMGASPAAATQTVWRFDNLTRIGGMAPRLEGKPALVDSPLGKAVAFNGKDDALFLPGRPLVGAKSFTIEAIFRPDGGDEQQRWMHIAETDPATGLDAAASGTSDKNPRFMFEIRVEGQNWYLDAYFNSKGPNQALAFPAKLHPLGRWYAVTQTYDGRFYRSYVDGVLQGEAEVPGFVPHGPGHTMIGTRMNHVNYFHGVVAEARFTDRALAPVQFLKAPANQAASNR
jgi:hypothetical protein